MKQTYTRCLAILLVGGLGSGCGPAGREQADKVIEELGEAGGQLARATEDVVRSVDQGGEGMGEAIRNVQRAARIDTDVDPIDFRTLREALPGELEGFTAGRAVGERTRVLGIGSSMAEVRFTREQGSIRVRITDTGSIASWAVLAGRAATTFKEIERESEHGFERSGMVDGMPVQESHDTQTGQSRISQFYGDRFVIELEGRQVDWDAMIAARKAVDWARLDQLNERKVETLRAADPG